MGILKKTLFVLGIFCLFIPATASAYELCGYDWNWTGNPMGSNYYINPNCTDPEVGSQQQQIDAINAGARAWDNEGNANFSFAPWYAGTTNATDYSGNDLNEIMFFQGDTIQHPYLDPNIIAVTLIWHTPPPGDITEVDMVWNDTDFTFSAVGNPTFQEKDVWNVAAHEFGHFLCLDHTPLSNATMYGGISNGETKKRDLLYDDVDGIQAIYGAAPYTNPVLDNGYVTPTEGSNRATFTYLVDYYDADGDSPTTPYVYIDGTPYSMSLDSGTPDNGTYRLDTVVGGYLGEVHNYYFYFEDANGGNDKLPVLEPYQGPTINQVINIGPPVPTPPPNIAPPLGPFNITPP